MVWLSTPFVVKGFSLLIGALFAGVIYKKYKKAVGYADKYLDAMNDVNYLLAVEDLHCRNNQELFGKSLRNSVRNAVTVERGLTWSGKNTKSSVNRSLTKVSSVKKQLAIPAEKLNESIAHGNFK